MIRRSKIGFVLLRYLLVLRLGRGRRDVSLVREFFLLGRGFRGHSIRPAVEARMRVIDDGRVVHDGRVHIRGMDDSRVHGYRSRVVRERAATPLTAGEASSAVTKPIVHAAVKANLRSPIPVIKNVSSAVRVAPISRCPEISRLGSCDPCSRNPIIVTFAIPCPVPRRPHVVRLWTRRLYVNRKSRRLDINADSDRYLCARYCGYSSQRSDDKNFAQQPHSVSFHSKPQSSSL